MKNSILKAVIHLKNASGGGEDIITVLANGNVVTDDTSDEGVDTFYHEFDKNEFEFIQQVSSAIAYGNGDL